MFLISIITVCRNAENTIAEAMTSVSEQNYKMVEHLVIDGASSDGTVSLAHKYARPGTRIVSEPDDGIFSAMNKGLLLASGDIVGFLNADDKFADNNSLSHIAAAFSSSNIEACYGDLVYVSRNNPNKIVRYWHSGLITKRKFSFILMPAHPTFYIKRSLLKKYGLFNLNYRLSNSDFEFMLRYLLSCKIRAMRTGGASNRNILQILYQNIDNLRALRRHRITPSYLFPLGKLLVKAREYMRRPKYEG